jgi:hypothetical protein
MGRKPGEKIPLFGDRRQLACQSGIGRFLAKVFRMDLIILHWFPRVAKPIVEAIEIAARFLMPNPMGSRRALR